MGVARVSTKELEEWRAYCIQRQVQTVCSTKARAALLPWQLDYYEYLTVAKALRAGTQWL